ncbi:DNA mismatch repair protein MutS [Hydrogenoanaerobacterium saccharovorans]|uniref:DNA mismatch repair protein MutS n=1 Tax=Hydrogenoanaerobacterium saccharovorans TaxID=474960 RepID=A0ABS2GKM3_9FIRM|nr:DNA mismatch repair protein MutS [Hydrogenoanaerobacterium saccharovorans]MBM6923035.1 DNA mismatch repair protein MutS [Hydrogenoanaerobacterium saccharovorans]
MAKLSPMMEQYFRIKEQHKDHILFYRLGDFYEMFYDDAILASKELELTLTGRDCGQEERAPMCGVPYHSCEGYIARLIKKGYKVAICEQMEDPRLAKGVVKREVIRVVTPGTLVETSMLDEGQNNFIASICPEGEQYGLAVADISTGEIHAAQFTDPDDSTLKNELSRFAPNEIVFHPAFLDKKEMAEFIRNRLSCCAECLREEQYDFSEAQRRVLEQFGKSDLSELSLDQRPLAVQAIGGLLDYLTETQMNGVDRLVSLDLYSESQFMALDLTARRNLELTETMRTGEKKGTLLWVLDRTRTAMGKRLIRQYVEQPLLSPAVIGRRLDAVDELYQDTMLRDTVRERLGGIYDMERLMTKIVFGNCTPRDVRTFGAAIAALPALRSCLEGTKSRFLREIYQEMDELTDIADRIGRAIVDDPPITLKDGFVIRDGYSAELDEVRSLVTGSREYLAGIESRERERTGIKNLRIGYNKVFGYYIEVTKSNLELVPADYIRKQTLSTGERYITEELKDLEGRILTASEKMLTMESELFRELREFISGHLFRIQRTAGAVARLDVFASFAESAMQNGYVRPMVDLSGVIRIEDGRHPVVEQLLDGGQFVANSLYLDRGENTVAIITGPNMAGKSTYMRQCALIVLMAQIGCFVPARSASIGIVDGIYTRVGASDDLATGQSTFMVEMNEVADILKNATRDSLLILDEIGRGTSTYDGMSIARAVIEYIADKKKLGAKTLFATHYHELTVLEDSIVGIRNFNIACRKRGEEIIFLRKIVPGGADESYGIEVSKLAGIPDEIIRRAFEILGALESGNPVNERRSRQPRKPAAEDQLTLAAYEKSPVERELEKIDVDSLSPREALTRLYELKAFLRK